MQASEDESRPEARRRPGDRNASRGPRQSANLCGAVESAVSTPSALDPIAQRLRGRIDRERLRQLAVPGPRRVLRCLALDWAVIWTGLIAVAWLDTWWVWSAAFVAIGLCQYRLFVLGHEAIHGCLHPDRRINDRIAQWTIYGPLLTGFEDSRRSHLVHHELLATPEDPERYLYGLANKNSKWRLLLLCTGVLTFAHTVERVIPYRSARASGGVCSAVRGRLPVFVMQAVGLALLWALGLPWWAYFVLWLAPIYVFVFVPDEVRSYCDHAVLVAPDEAGDAQRLVTYLPGRLERLVLAPYNLHHQAEHHVFPELPCHALPAAHAVIGEDDAVTVRGSYLGFLWQTFWALPLDARGSAERPVSG